MVAYLIKTMKVQQHCLNHYTENICLDSNINFLFYTKISPSYPRKSTVTTVNYYRYNM